jgi:hypothetical protein
LAAAQQERVASTAQDNASPATDSIPAIAARATQEMRR